MNKEMTTFMHMKHRFPKLDIKKGIIELAHGSGGRAMAQLIEQIFMKAFENEYLMQKNDQACFKTEAKSMVMTTDSYVISPLFFPGGNIGNLAVYGTINDIAMAGAEPLYLSASFILEEGFLLSDLNTIVQTMAAAAKAARVKIITGDTKVVEKGKGDGVFITTTGVGILSPHIHISANRAKPGDKIIVSGYIGDHGVAVMSQRENLNFFSSVYSDTAPLHELVSAMIEIVPDIHCLRDPTRGGLATTLNELAAQSHVGILIEEQKIPIRESVTAACELLGLDPLYVANEGKLIAICKSSDVEKLLTVMHSHPLGQEAAVIGEVVVDPACFVQMRTIFGGKRIVDWLAGEQLPRIC